LAGLHIEDSCITREYNPLCGVQDVVGKTIESDGPPAPASTAGAKPGRGQKERLTRSAFRPSVGSLRAETAAATAKGTAVGARRAVAAMAARALAPSTAVGAGRAAAALAATAFAKLAVRARTAASTLAAAALAVGTIGACRAALGRQQGPGGRGRVGGRRFDLRCVRFGQVRR